MQSAEKTRGHMKIQNFHWQVYVREWILHVLSPRGGNISVTDAALSSRWSSPGLISLCHWQLHTKFEKQYLLWQNNCNTAKTSDCLLRQTENSNDDTSGVDGRVMKNFVSFSKWHLINVSVLVCGPWPVSAGGAGGVPGSWEGWQGADILWRHWWHGSKSVGGNCGPTR